MKYCSHMSIFTYHPECSWDAWDNHHGNQHFSEMAVMLATILYATVFIIIFLAIIYYLYHKHVTFNYWKNNGIPYEEPVMICGNLLKSSLGLTSIGEWSKYSLSFKSKSCTFVFILALLPRIGLSCTRQINY